MIHWRSDKFYRWCFLLSAVHLRGVICWLKWWHSCCGHDLVIACLFVLCTWIDSSLRVLATIFGGSSGIQATTSRFWLLVRLDEDCWGRLRDRCLYKAKFWRGSKVLHTELLSSNRWVKQSRQLWHWIKELRFIAWLACYMEWWAWLVIFYWSSSQDRGRHGRGVVIA